MTTMNNDEREERLKWLRVRRDSAAQVAKERGWMHSESPSWNDIDFLLSLLDSQVAGDNRAVLDRVLTGARTNDPVGVHLTELWLQQSEEPDIYDAVRDRIRDDAATRMRDLCVERVKAMRDGWQSEANAKRDPDDPHDYKGSYGLASGAVDACDDIIEALERLES